MKGKLFLTYFARLSYVPKEYKTCRISRTVPNGINLDYLFPNLYPTKLLLSFYKSNKIDFNEYTQRYLEHALTVGQPDILNIKEKLDNGENLVLVCYEKNHLCHRFILGAIFEHLGYEVNEI